MDTTRESEEEKSEGRKGSENERSEEEVNKGRGEEEVNEGRGEDNEDVSWCGL